MKRYAFISHPYADNPEGNKKKVDTICKDLLDAGKVVPISPLHLFSFYSQDADRDEIMKACKHLIDMCDTVYVYGNSSGCSEEMHYAMEQKKPVKVLFGEV